MSKSRKKKLKRKLKQQKKESPKQAVTKKAVKFSNPHPQPKQAIPQTVVIELAPKAYFEIKDVMLKKTNPIVRDHLNTYFQWLSSLQTAEVTVSIETGETLKQAYEHAPYRWRLAVALARGFLKAAPKYREQFRQFVNLDVALMTLRYENPQVYAIIQRYGQKGINYLKQCLEDAKELFGLTAKAEAEE